MALLFRVARSSLGRLLIGWLFAHVSFLLPVQRVRETRTLIVFQHPQPSYPLHLLLVPKKALGSLLDLTSADADFLVEVFQTVQSLVAEFDLETSGYRLIVNGGAYQDVAQLHFHLIAEGVPANRNPA